MGLLITSSKSKLEKTLPLQEAITESVYASSIVKSTNQCNVFSAVNGLIAEIVVKEGDEAKKGDAIIRLVNTNAQLNTENAALSANYNDINANAEELNELQIDINYTKDKLDADKLLQARQQNLWNESIGTKNQLEQRQLSYKSSVTAYEAAKLHYTQLKKRINFQGSQYKQNLKIAATIKNGYTIKSKVNGRVYNIIRKLGEKVNTLTPMAVISNAEVFMIELQVDEYDTNRIKLKQNILLSMDS
jgi:HlyD family secretion protein